MRLPRLLVAACAVLGAIASAAAADLTLHTYHSTPPFVTGDGKGLTYELAEYMTRKSNGALTVKVSVLPRGRVDRAVQAADFGGAVPWVFPAWFKDKDRTRYLWSEALFPDENIIVSSPAKRIDYTGPDSLAGTRFAGVLGHAYAGIDDLVKSGQIRRQDARNEESNLKKVAAGRADATLLPGSAADFLVPQLGIADRIHVSANPQSQYTRHLLLGKGSAELLRQVDAIVVEMKNDPAWQEILKKYRIASD